MAYYKHVIDNYDQEGIVEGNVFRTLMGMLKTFDLHEIVDDFLGGFWGISRGLVLGIIFTGLFTVLWRLIPDLPLFAFEWLIGTMPIWLLPTAIVGGWK